MALQCGIVGLPNVGKSTLFNCLSNAKAQSANFPFCTIEPNVGVITVPDERLNKLAELINPQRIVPTTVEIVDIAGLVKGASKGEGLGNKFLANIRETDAIIHVLRCFDDDNITHVDGSVDPVRNKEIIDYVNSIKPVTANPFWNYLELLRRSGVTNMYGATPYLAKKFSINHEEAANILCDWMSNYNRSDYEKLENPEDLVNYVIQDF